MLDPVINFFSRIFYLIGRGIGYAVGILLWPFLWAGRWYTQRGWILKAVVGAILILWVGLYGYFFWVTQVWTNFNPDYVAAYNFDKRDVAAGEPVAAQAVGTAPKSCARSAIVEVTADLTDFNVNQNAWISSMLLFKLGFFGMSWDDTPFLDNKAAFQRGINSAVRRTAVELVDTLGRVRGTSQIDNDLQKARGNLQFTEDAWYFGLNPFGPKTPTPSYYRSAVKDLRTFNSKLETCSAVFDARADNLMQFIDRIANDIGSTSAILKDRSEKNNYGWFDTRADDRFWFAYGQLYAYYGLMNAAKVDFKQVVQQKNLAPLWDGMDGQLRSALNITPWIIANGSEGGWLLPNHLTTMGFYILRVRSNLIDIKQVLQQ
ncbi:DUF2333 family protein [Phyllobacterium myrsinacearum]|uniref:DUF2333 domain-containing protein n=2 Tax=Pseudomonadota TaxID=1224 RepID=A0A2S9JWR7_9HYPH|nr:DUF2333 family protein [Phyllobacterium myrsinacearum]PRD57756.1 DUF2333 domain-containing protein [Phyllobacterium myrsinacearum]PWV88539.1 hypothetical protein DEV92_11072 [Phyllobacterium myrsinacearum]RZS83197.1 hypothetical protein EV217_1938 [Phyllobacterium myrsinacearum]RZV10095.1 hypothetical protein EV654_1198 [Phyllobacterium myrsinacearum]